MSSTLSLVGDPMLLGWYQAQTERSVESVSVVGNMNDCPTPKSPEGLVVAAPVCVNTAELLPAHGPAACVVGAVVEAVKGPSVLEVSASILFESNV